MKITAASAFFPSGPGMALAGIALDVQMALNRQHPFYVDRSGSAVRASFFPQPATFDSARWVAMAQAVLLDLQQQLPPDHIALQTGAELDLWLVLPPSARAGVPADLATALISACQGAPFSFGQIKFISGGHAAPVQALHQAAQALQTQPAAHAAIVMALDSWLHPAALEWLERENLLHNAGKPFEGRMRRNPWGRIPGEAAAAVMLCRHGPAWCQILGLGAAAEAIPRNDERPCLGHGWTQAALQALTTLPPTHKVSDVFSDLNGEPYRADQFGFTLLRLSDRLAANWQRHTPALVSGDVGCASALLHTALSAHALHQAGASAQTHLLLSASDDNLRAALVLTQAL